MKLRIEPQPDGYDLDKAIVLHDESTDTVIVLGCENSKAIARKIAHRVNMYDVFVETLTIFGSQQMGQLLLDVVLENAPPGVSEDDMNKVHDRLRRLVNAVDVVLKAVELHKTNQGEIN